MVPLVVQMFVLFCPFSGLGVILMSLLYILIILQLLLLLVSLTSDVKLLNPGHDQAGITLLYLREPVEWSVVLDVLPKEDSYWRGALTRL